MRRRSIAVLSFALAAALTVPLDVAAVAAVHTGSQQSSASQAAPGSVTTVSAGTHAAAKKKHKQKGKRGKKGRKPGRALTSMRGLNNAVKVTWTAAPRATRYRVKWAFAPWDHWKAGQRYSPWLSAATRSKTRVLSTNPSTDRTMSATAYGNPIWARVQAASGKRLGPWSAWRVVWPAVQRPAAGDPVRLGTYNVMLAGRTNWAARSARIAQNIAARGLGIVCLQETLSTNGSGIASKLTSLTGRTWKVAPTGDTEGRILYDATKFALKASGVLNSYSPAGHRIQSYRTGATIPLPYARFNATGSYRSFVVTSAHFAPSNISSTPTAASNRQTGASARAVMAALNNGVLRSSEPAVIAGDFAGGYSRWGDPNGAQPTMVRAGWWDAMASMSKQNVAYATVNKRASQKKAVTVGGRADGIFLKGIKGTTRYVNVVNYFMPGTKTPPSDHNLIYTDFQVPN